MLTYALIAAFCLLLSSFFSISETAVTGASRAIILSKMKQGSRKAKIIYTLLKNPNSLITSLLVGNNIANIFFTAIITSIFVQNFGERYLFVLGLAITIVVLIFAEILPKTYSFSNPTNIALFLSPGIYFISALFKPISYTFLKVNKFILIYILRYRPRGNSDLFASVDNLRGAIEMLEREDESHQITNQEKAMLHGILDLNELVVADILNHRKNVFCIDIDDPNNENIEKILNCAYTRIPIFQEKPENIIGIINVKDVFKAYKKEGSNFTLKDLMVPSYFVPDSTYVIDLLMAFRTNKERMALIVDEYGSFMGILTLGDILEEITGDLSYGEQMNHHEQITSHKDSLIVPGDLKIRDLNRKMNWVLPDKDFTTVAGLILYETGKIPNVGNAFILHGFKFEVIEKRRHQLTKIKIRQEI